ncbi:hypothetical protein GCM10011574_43360 [Microbispora bryophytorum]|uniref:Uncharacterized protein n=1 Tax=Microbispora bryophytorum TaxID=1460882 RepID=A0A8H9H218_9ACTN|nr:hypothetical protein GCM10011574_43360 [Microbispora bryophytorum]
MLGKGAEVSVVMNTFAHYACPVRMVCSLSGSGPPDRRSRELPPSYRQFLLFADGWGAADDEYCIRSVATAGWLRDLEPWLAEG